MRKLLFLFFILLSLFFTRALYYSLSQGFTIDRITFPETVYSPSPTPTPQEMQQLEIICSTPFYYLAKGSQSYAFESEDGDLILKLFKCHHWNDASWAENLYLPQRLHDWFNSLVKRRRVKVANMKKSLHIVKKFLQEECAVLYMQETPSTSYSLPVTIVDGTGRSYIIDLCNYGYAIQAKAQLIFPKLQAMIDKEEKEKVRSALSSIVALLYKRCKKGIWDSDPDLKKNSALIGTTAIHIDIGSFYEKSQFDEQLIIQDINKTIYPLKKWMEKHAPEFVPELMALASHPETAIWRSP